MEIVLANRTIFLTGRRFFSGSCRGNNFECSDYAECFRLRARGVFTDADGAEYLKISVVSIPEKGKANKELLSFLAKRLKTAKSNFEIISGASERCKRILIKGIDAVQTAEILRQGE
ncbi:MAG: DUF167 family protein [Alphaproteobacteria bacterium]